jgi:hypothetical protein
MVSSMSFWFQSDSRVKSYEGVRSGGRNVSSIKGVITTSGGNGPVSFEVIERSD